MEPPRNASIHEVFRVLRDYSLHVHGFSLFQKSARMMSKVSTMPLLQLVLEKLWTLNQFLFTLFVTRGDQVGVWRDTFGWCADRTCAGSATVRPTLLWRGARTCGQKILCGDNIRTPLDFYGRFEPFTVRISCLSIDLSRLLFNRNVHLLCLYNRFHPPCMIIR